MSNFVLYIMVLFSILGGIDKLLNNRYGLGEKFEEAFNNMGGLALSMIGIIGLAPILSGILTPILQFLSKISGADPSIFMSSLLAVDLGGYVTSAELARSQQIAEFSGLLLASMMGVTISFTIPVAINMISKDDFPFFAIGILSGIVTIPVGMIAGGLTMGIGIKEILINLIPVIILSIIIIIGLLKYQEIILRIFSGLGRCIAILCILGLIISILDFVLGIKLLPNMIPFEDSIIVVGKTVVMISGAYPLFHFISKKLDKNLNKIAGKLGINEYSFLGIITSLANNVATLRIYDKMDARGKVLSAAFIVSSAFTFGGQLGYISSISKDIIPSYLLAKLSAAISSLLLASILLKVMGEKKPELKSQN